MAGSAGTKQIVKKRCGIIVDGMRGGDEHAERRGGRGLYGKERGYNVGK